jgi:hypothetical protein
MKGVGVEDHHAVAIAAAEECRHLDYMTLKVS